MHISAGIQGLLVIWMTLEEVPRLPLTMLKENPEQPQAQSSPARGRCGENLSPAPQSRKGGGDEAAAGYCQRT